MPSVHCPHCGKSLTVPDEVIGKKGRCPKCQKSFIIQPTPEPDEFTEPGDATEYDDFNTPEEYDDFSSPDEFDDDLTESEPKKSLPKKPQKTHAKGKAKAQEGQTKKKKKSDTKEQKPLPRWVWPAASGGVLLLILLIWIFSGGGDGDLGVSEGLAAAEQAPRHGLHSWVPIEPIPSADPASWKVTPDPVPLATGLRSAIALPDSNVYVVLFAGPSSTKAAVLRGLRNPGNNEQQTEWVQFDLKDGSPVARTTIMPMGYSGRDAKFAAALSPSGGRLAIEDAKKAGSIAVFSPDGKEVTRFDAPRSSETYRTEWVAFAGEDRVLSFADKKVTGFDANSGQQVYALEASFLMPPAISPGGKWVAGYTGKGYEFFSAADGQKAGVLPLPGNWENTIRPQSGIGGQSFHLDGKHFAGFAFDNRIQMLSAVWDLSDGSIKESVVLPDAYDGSSQPQPPAVWSGDRRIVFSTGEVLDLDLRTVICKYEMNATHPIFGSSPDGRVWRVTGRPTGATVPKPQSGESLGSGQTLLAATTLPHDGALAVFDSAREGFLWHPGTSLRVELDKSIPKDQREKTLEAISDGVTQAGIQVDPAAKVRMTVTTGVDRDDVLGRTTQYLGPTLEEREVVSGFVLFARFDITDENGNQLMRQPYFAEGISAPDYEGDAEERVWGLFRDSARKGLRFPTVFMRNSSGELLPAKQFFSPGIDGVVEPAPIEQQGHQPTNEFQLKSDPK